MHKLYSTPTNANQRQKSEPATKQYGSLQHKQRAQRGPKSIGQMHTSAPQTVKRCESNTKPGLLIDRADIIQPKNLPRLRGARRMPGQ